MAIDSLHAPRGGLCRPPVGGPLTDAEDHEFGRLDHGDADQADQATIVEVVLGHRGAVAADEKGFLRPVAHQRAVAPLVEQEVGDSLADVGPERLVVVFEDGPLRAAVDGVLQISEVAPYADVLPLRVGADGAGSPGTKAAALEEPEAIDADRIEDVVLPLVDQGFEADGAEDDLVGRGLDHAMDDVATGVDPGHEPAWRKVQLAAAIRVEGIDDGD